MSKGRLLQSDKNIRDKRLLWPVCKLLLFL